MFRNEELEAVMAHTGLAAPMSASPWYLLVEVEERHTVDLEVPDQAAVGRDLWLYRDRITESLATLGVIHKYDVVVPPSGVESLLERLAPAIAPHRLFVMGHVKMADFHLNVAPSEPGRRVPGSVDEVVYAAVVEAGGEVAGEHGIGRAKADRARRVMSDGQRAMIDRIKRAFDPEERLNPGAGAARP